MGLVDQARGLIGYNAWANRKFLKAVSMAQPEDLQIEIGPDAGTVAECLRHMAEVQRGWFATMTGANYERRSKDLDPLDGLEDVFAASESEMNAFGEAATEVQLDKVVAGNWKAWQLLTHLVNHSTHHRSEIGRVLGNRGYSPGDLDFIFYLGEAGS